jgi:hypothetical protein
MPRGSETNMNVEYIVSLLFCSESCRIHNFAMVTSPQMEFGPAALGLGLPQGSVENNIHGSQLDSPNLVQASSSSLHTSFPPQIILWLVFNYWSLNFIFSPGERKGSCYFSWVPWSCGLATGKLWNLMIISKIFRPTIFTILCATNHMLFTPKQISVRGDADLGLVLHQTEGNHCGLEIPQRSQGNHEASFRSSFFASSIPCVYVLLTSDVAWFSSLEVMSLVTCLYGAPHLSSICAA